MQRIVEERIRKAEREGLFEDLPGKGRKLKLKDESHIHPSLRVSFKILKNAGLLPPEMQLRREIADLKALLNQAQAEAEAEELIREINEKVLALNVMSGLSVNTEMNQIYGDKILDRLRSRRARLELGRLKEKGLSAKR
ncbi:MAG: DUF1992 domain-containing protein [bacterium]|nr:MAG: DUF1992 domain-containing protein [bacterium]